MTDYTALANAIETTLRGDSWVNAYPNIKIIESFKRDIPLQGAGSPFFKINEHPLIIIRSKSSGKSETATTASAKTLRIPVQLLVVSGDEDVQVASVNHETINYNVERVLENENVAANGSGFGISGYLEDIKINTVRMKKGKVFYFMSRITFNVELNG